MAKYCLFTAKTILDEDVDAYVPTAPRRVGCWKNLRVARAAEKTLKKKLKNSEDAVAFLCRGAKFCGWSHGSGRRGIVARRAARK